LTDVKVVHVVPTQDCRVWQKEDQTMVDTATKLPIKTDGKAVASPPAAGSWHPFDDLRREVDRLFEDFGRGNWMRPFRSIEPMFQRAAWGAPAVDIVERDTAFEIAAELPGMEAKNVEVTLRNGSLVLKGEKREEKEEKSKDYYLKERQYGSFERSFAVPAGVDTAKIAAEFKNGVLRVTMPKTADAQKPAQKVAIKAA
jgi:HSP20 family protein